MSEERDPQETYPHLKHAFAHVERLLDEEFPGRPAYMGQCFEIWDRKKWLLRNKYNIEWQSPAELNPDSLYD